MTVWRCGDSGLHSGLNIPLHEGARSEALRRSTLICNAYVIDNFGVRQITMNNTPNTLGILDL